MNLPPIANTSYWIATSGEEARPALSGDAEVDLVVVGGGITGLTAAVVAARGGARVMVLEGLVYSELAEPD